MDVESGRNGSRWLSFFLHVIAKGECDIGGRVLLAVEDKMAGRLLEHLHGIRQFTGWDFQVCGAVRKLLDEAVPDTLVLSRFLAGSERSLVAIGRRFARARVIFWIGRADERGLAFERRAVALGFAPNFVTGDLPGDQPYPLSLALLHDYAEVTGEDPASPVMAPGGTPLPGGKGADRPGRAGGETGLDRIAAAVPGYTVLAELRWENGTYKVGEARGPFAGYLTEELVELSPVDGVFVVSGSHWLFGLSDETLLLKRGAATVLVGKRKRFNRAERGKLAELWGVGKHFEGISERQLAGEGAGPGVGGQSGGGGPGGRGRAAGRDP